MVITPIRKILERNIEEKNCENKIRRKILKQRKESWKLKCKVFKIEKKKKNNCSQRKPWTKKKNHVQFERILHHFATKWIQNHTQKKKKKNYLKCSYLFPHFTPDMAQSFRSIKAHCLQTSITQHFYHLSVFLFIFFENQFTFLRFIFIFTTPTIFSTFSLKQNSTK